jgi:hypothetical protein
MTLTLRGPTIMETLTSYDTLNPISYTVAVGGMTGKTIVLHMDTPVQLDNGLPRRAVRSERCTCIASRILGHSSETAKPYFAFDRERYS